LQTLSIGELLILNDIGIDFHLRRKNQKHKHGEEKQVDATLQHVRFAARKCDDANHQCQQEQWKVAALHAERD
jgi:hypothetical protein